MTVLPKPPSSTSPRSEGSCQRTSACSLLVANGSCPDASTTSTINLSGGARANRVLVSLGPDTSGGPATDVCVYNAAGSIDFVLDANGWFGSSLTSTPLGAQFQAIGPTRVCDTRAGSATPCASHTLGAGGNALHRRCWVSGAFRQPVLSRSLPTSRRSPRPPSTYLIAYPSDVTLRPNASDLNIVGPVLPNLVVVGLSHLAPAGNLRLFNARGYVNAILDVEGWFQ